MAQPHQEVLKAFYIHNIVNTLPNQKVKRKEFLIGRTKRNITGFVLDIHISSWSLKHIYDKRELFCNMFVNHSYSIINYPDYIYKNRPEKDGDYLFIKKIGNYLLCSVLEFVNNKLFVITVFPIRKGYLDLLERIH